VLRGRLDPEVGAVLEKALEWASEALFRKGRGEEVEGGAADGSEAPSRGPDSEGDSAESFEVEANSPRRTEVREDSPTFEQGSADALGLVAERALMAAEGLEGKEQGRAHRFQVVLHVEAVGRGSGRAAGHLAGSGLGVSAGTSRRLTCDAAVVRVEHDPWDGSVLDVGRRRRTVPPRLRLALEHRDGGQCRFPGCGCRYTDAHHIHHWAESGETKLDNLVLLCRRHHRAVHEEGFRVAVVEDGRAFRFYRPEGCHIPQVPAMPPAGTSVPASPVRALAEGNRRRGVNIHAWTPTPDWHGESLDLGIALDMLRPDP
jgi:5-methylcytosine-specific restriction endonuclease McrA